MTGLPFKTSDELEFTKRLDSFRAEAEAPSQYLYALLTCRELAAIDSRVFNLFNTNADFWNVALNALHSTSFLALHRLFDGDSIDRADDFLLFAIAKRHIFSRDALDARIRSRNGGETFPWVADVRNTTEQEIQRLRGEVQRWWKVYDKLYRPIRSKVLAHKILEREEADELFKKLTSRNSSRCVCSSWGYQKRSSAFT